MRSKGLRTFLRRLADDRHGAALPILAAFTIPAIGAIGTGIDTARIYMVRSQMQAGVDAAVEHGMGGYAQNLIEVDAVVDPQRSADLCIGYEHFCQRLWS